jgi:hypothetical protein
MKHNNRFFTASLIALAVLFFSSQAFAAVDAFIWFKNTSTGNTFKCKIDNDGKFSCPNVEPGKYDVIFVCSGETSPTGEKKSGCPSSIEISSFSWGTSNTAGKQGKSTQVTRSNISNNRAAGFTVDATGPVVTIDGVRVATADVNGDGVSDKISSPVSVSLGHLVLIGHDYSQVVLKDIVVSSESSKLDGAVKASWNLKENVK